MRKIVITLLIWLVMPLLACAGRSESPRRLPAMIQAVVFEDNQAQVADLIAKTHDVNVRDEFGRTPLMYAAGVHLGESDRQMLASGKLKRSSENVAVVSLLLDNGADANAVSNDGQTALKVATYHGRSATIKLLFEHGANPNLAGAGTSPLTIAAVHCYTDILRTLLEYGANPDMETQQGKTMLHTAIQDCPEAIKVIQEHKRR